MTLVAIVQLALGVGVLLVGLPSWPTWRRWWLTAGLLAVAAGNFALAIWAWARR